MLAVVVTSWQLHFYVAVFNKKIVMTKNNMSFTIKSRTNCLLSVINYFVSWQNFFVMDKYFLSWHFFFVRQIFFLSVTIIFFWTIIFCQWQFFFVMTIVFLSDNLFFCHRWCWYFAWLLLCVCINCLFYLNCSVMTNLNMNPSN